MRSHLFLERVSTIPRLKSKETKDIIKEAAIKVIAEVGFHHCNTDQIAREAGYSVGTIYNYFKNKEDILKYIFKVQHDQMKEMFGQLLELKEPVPVIIKTFFRQYYQRTLNNVRLGKLILDESNRLTQGLNEDVVGFLLLIDDFLKDLLERGVKEGTIRDDIPPGVMASVIMGASNSMVLRGFLNQLSLKKICDHAPDHLYHILLAGIFRE